MPLLYAGSWDTQLLLDGSLQAVDLEQAVDSSGFTALAALDMKLIYFSALIVILECKIIAALATPVMLLSIAQVRFLSMVHMHTLHTVMHVYTHMQTHSHTHTHTHTHTYTRHTHTHTSFKACTNTHIHVHTRTYTDTHTLARTHKHMFKHTQMHTNLYITETHRPCTHILLQCTMEKSLL